MKSFTFAKAAMAFTLGVALVGGCDPSKEELDKTKEQLTKVTVERDMIKKEAEGNKAEMDKSKAEMDAMKAKLTEAETKLATCAPAAAVPEPVAPTKSASKSSSKPANPNKLIQAPKVDTTQPVGAAANPIKVTPKTGGY